MKVFTFGGDYTGVDVDKYLYSDKNPSKHKATCKRNKSKRKKKSKKTHRKK